MEKTVEQPSNPLSRKLTLESARCLGRDALLTRTEAAEVLRVSDRTLERWDSLGSGPKPLRIGPRRVAYTVGSVIDFAGVAA